MLGRSRVLRFAVVGVANAAISFGVLNLCFYKLGQGKIVSSIIATTCALLFSFTMNRSFVFADKSRRIHKQFIPFAAVTISGSLIVINIVYVLSLHLLNGHEGELIRLTKDVSGLKFSKSFVDINVSTVIGAVVAMVWNYNGYRLFVFKGKVPAVEESHEKIETADEAN